MNCGYITFFVLWLMQFFFVFVLQSIELSFNYSILWSITKVYKLWFHFIIFLLYNSNSLRLRFFLSRIHALFVFLSPSSPLNPFYFYFFCQSYYFQQYLTMAFRPLFKNHSKRANLQRSAFSIFIIFLFYSKQSHSVPK